MSKLKNRKVIGYAKLLAPKGNELDGYTVSNEFEKTFFKYSSQGLDNQAEEMMADWIYNKIKQEEDAIFQGISNHQKINI
ncbi:hypothetical protein [Aeromonas veronii]|uniref:hypothetical protein n=1 Tax=Aeromonas veronii TaxID=654 RepID=UPI0018F24406|nr:hypothetical protein [Aeromonas veronii]MBJ7592178.1 hypothetical protein [Aeromonas veronii]